MTEYRANLERRVMHPLLHGMQHCSGTVNPFLGHLCFQVRPYEKSNEHRILSRALEKPPQEFMVKVVWSKVRVLMAG